MFARVDGPPERRPVDLDKEIPRTVGRLFIRISARPRLEPKDDSLRMRTATRILELAADTLILVLMLGSISLVEFVAKQLMDLDRNFVLRWMIHVAHLLAFLKYVYNVILDLRK